MQTRRTHSGNMAFLAKALCVLAFALSAPQARILSVGPGQTYAKPSLAAKDVQDGDTVQIAAGLYEGDVCAWSASNLTLRAPSKYAHLDGKGTVAQGKAIWVITGNNVLVENIEFSGAAITPDSNGAGIRPEGGDLTVRNCYFHDNEDGILTGGGNSNIVIEYCEFADNGNGNGYTHNIYVGNVTSFTLRYSYIHHSKVGHNVKSRALKSLILYNRIMSEADGTTSYEVDFPDGGEAYVIGNLVQHGPKSENPTMITFGEESLKNPKKELYVIGNTLVDERDAPFIFAKTGTATAKVDDNLLVGADRQAILNGAGDTAGNVRTDKPGFVDAANYDYRLTAASPAIDKGPDPGSANGMSLSPVFQYVHKANGEARPTVGKLDAGAYEYSGANPVRKPRSQGSVPGSRNRSGAAGVSFLGNKLWISLRDADGFSWTDFRGKTGRPAMDGPINH